MAWLEGDIIEYFGRSETAVNAAANVEPRP